MALFAALSPPSPPPKSYTKLAHFFSVPSLHYHHHLFLHHAAQDSGNAMAVVLKGKQKGGGSFSKVCARVAPAAPTVSSPQLMEELVSFLEADLPHLFDEQGIDKSRYEEKVIFKDPITRYSTLDGYLFNIQMLRFLFSPIFELHKVKQTGPNEITTRWTMTMNFSLLPWRPQLIFSGTSVMSVNPESGKFYAHVDYWDSIKDNEYFSIEGLIDLVKQLRYYRTPELETPAYSVLKRTSLYEIRRYEPYIVVEAQGDKLTGFKGYNDIIGYIFGQNSKRAKISITTPIFTETFDKQISNVHVQVVLPLRSELDGLPKPLQDKVAIKQKDGGFVAAIKFSGQVTEDMLVEKERLLRSALVRDELPCKEGFMLARYNDPSITWSFLMRNEVLIHLEDFTLDIP